MKRKIVKIGLETQGERALVVVECEDGTIWHNVVENNEAGCLTIARKDFVLIEVRSKEIK